MDSRSRSLAKSLLWRVIATTNGIIVAFGLTGDFSKGFKIGVIGNITGLILYYIHERLWSRIKWGVAMADEKPLP